MNKLIALGVFLLVSFIGLLLIVKIHTVGGNQIGVLETWSQGVVEQPLQPKTYFWIPGFNKRAYNYAISQQVYVMNDRDDGTEFGEGRKGDSYLVQSAEGQDMKISSSTQWRRDPSMIIELHKTVKDNVEERILRPELMRVIKDEATTRSALQAYSGEGLVELQRDILAKLRDPESELRKRGIIVDNFVIENIGLDPKYREQITARQVAVQSRLRAIEETRAAEAEADKAKAVAQADFERSVVEARRDKEVGVLSAQKLAEQRVLAAQASAKEVELASEAEKNRNVLIAEGEKLAGVLRAEAILALGTAEAEATALKLNAYSSTGSEAFVKIEVAKSMAEAFQNIKGYLPESMSVNLLTEQYTKGVSLLVSGE